MAVPPFQEFMRPVLSLHEDGQPHYKRDLWREAADLLHLSEEDRREQIPSGRQLRYTNRIDWAISHMAGARLLDRPRRGYTAITERGRQALARADRIDMNLLKTFPEYQAFRTGDGRSGIGEEPAVTGPGTATATTDERTPEERLVEAFEEVQLAVVDELLEYVQQQSPAFFERLVLDLLVAMRYGADIERAAGVLGGTADAGLDGVIRQDRLGLDEIYVQAKRWQGPVGRPVIQAFVGALQGARASKGVVITTSSFTAGAKSYVRDLGMRVVLIDGSTLARLMLEHGVGVSDTATYVLKKIDTDYFLDDAGAGSVA